MSLYRWSQSAASNGTADPTCPFPEGQAASSLNDSCRGAMAAVAQYRDDIAGAIVTGGTSSLYTVSSYQDFDSLADMDGKTIAFSPNQTNVDGVQLNVDGLGAFPLRYGPYSILGGAAALVAGTLIQGTPYTALFNNANGEFYLKGFAGNPYNVPFLAGMDFWGTLAPNSRFIFPAGQAISRTVYAAAFAEWGTTFGSGDGSTTFNVPDKTGRVSAMIEASATRLTSTYFGGNSTLLGETGNSSEKNTLVTANLPPYRPQGSIANGAITISHNANSQNGGSTTGGGGFPVVSTAAATISASQGASTFTGSAQGGTSTPFCTVPPLITCNYIIRIL